MNIQASNKELIQSEKGGGESQIDNITDGQYLSDAKLPTHSK